MDERFCTVHQCLDKRGRPMVQESEVRLPGGQPIPYVASVVLEAVPATGDGMWMATIRMPVVFGGPLYRPVT